MSDQKTQQTTQSRRDAEKADKLSLDKETLKDLQATDDADKVRGAQCCKSYGAIV